MRGPRRRMGAEASHERHSAMVSSSNRDPVLIQDYAQRRQTVSEHQQLLALYLGFRPFGSAERDALGHFVRDEADVHLPIYDTNACIFERYRLTLMQVCSH